MPKYFFDVDYHRGTYRDEFGDDFCDDQQASDQAQAIVSHILREHLFDVGFERVICSVRNGPSQSIYQLQGSFTDAVPD